VASCIHRGTSKSGATYWPMELKSHTRRCNGGVRELEGTDTTVMCSYTQLAWCITWSSLFDVAELGSFLSEDLRGTIAGVYKIGIMLTIPQHIFVMTFHNRGKILIMSTSLRIQRRDTTEGDMVHYTVKELRTLLLSNER